MLVFLLIYLLVGIIIFTATSLAIGGRFMWSLKSIMNVCSVIIFWLPMVIYDVVVRRVFPL